MKALVTGANGFLGRHVVGALLARGIEVRTAIRGSVRGGRIDHVAGQQALSRIVVGNEGDVTESQRMPEPFVVAEEEHLVFFNWSA